MHEAPGGGAAVEAPTRPGATEELTAGPGAMAERVHPHGSVTRVDAGGRCEVLTHVAPDGSTSVVVRQDEGRSWHRAVPGPGGQGAYQLHLADIVVSGHHATFTAIRRPGAGWVLVVVEGTVEVTSPDAGAVEVSALQAVKISARGVGTLRQLTPSEVQTQPWVVRNRARDGHIVPFAPAPQHLPAPAEPATPSPAAGDRAAGTPRRHRARRPELDGLRRRLDRLHPRLTRSVVLVLVGLLALLRQAPPVARRLLDRARSRSTTVVVAPLLRHGRVAVRRVEAAGARLRRRTRPRRATIVIGGLVLGILVMAPDAGPTMAVTVNDQAVRIPRSQATVAEALAAAGVTSPEGALLAAGSGRVVDPHFVPPTVVVNGLPASPDTQLGDGAVLEVAASADVVEPTGERRVPTPAPPLPEVEFTLWYPGADGVEDQVYGLLSGEVVSRTPVRAPVPPRQETGNVVALTFDDGPHPQWTPQILDTLASEGVRATFCVVGDLTRRHPDLLRAVADAGHAVCNHTQTHAVDLDRAEGDKVAREIEGASVFLESILGEAPRLYRPPAGSLSPAVIDVAHQGGMRVLHWTIDSRDFTKPPPEELVGRILAGVRPGAVILLHDGDGDRSRTAAALRPLIQQLRERGFTFATPLSPP